MHSVCLSVCLSLSVLVRHFTCELPGVHPAPCNSTARWQACGLTHTWQRDAAPVPSAERAPGLRAGTLAHSPLATHHSTNSPPLATALLQLTATSATSIPSLPRCPHRRTGSRLAARSLTAATAAQVQPPICKLGCVGDGCGCGELRPESIVPGCSPRWVPGDVSHMHDTASIVPVIVTLNGVQVGHPVEPGPDGPGKAHSTISSAPNPHPNPRPHPDRNPTPLP